MSTRRGGPSGSMPPPGRGVGKSGVPRPEPGALPPAPPPSTEISSMPSMLASGASNGSISGAVKRGGERPDAVAGPVQREIATPAAAGSPNSRPMSRAAGGQRAASPDFWSRSTAAQLVDSSVKNPELKLQLLTRALEESRSKVQHMQRDHTALADALAALCAAAGAADADSRGAAGKEEDESVLPRRLDLLSTQLARLQGSLRDKEAAVVEAEAAHERAALQVVAQQQHKEALERELEETRYTVQQHERAQHAMQVKLGLLEDQLSATAESARRRMEEQLLTFRGDATTARTLRNKFAELEDQLEAAQRAQHAEAEQARQLAAQAERLKGRLSDASHKQAELSQQLLDKSTALTDLTAEHRRLQADAQALASTAAQLQGAHDASQQRAQRAEDLGLSLQAQCAAGHEAQAALQSEVEQLRADLQQEREQKHRLQSALAEEQLCGATQRASLQGRTDEVASLLQKLEEYSNRIVNAEGQLDASAKQAAAAEAAQRAAQEAGRAARHENASLHDSLTDLAASEARWRQQLGQVEGDLAAANSSMAEARERIRQQDEAAAAAHERTQRLQQTVGEQARQLEGMRAVQQELEGQQQQVVDLKQELQAASARARDAQAAADELSAAKQAAQRDMHKQQVLVQRLQEQSTKQAAELRAAGKELAEARQRAEEVEGEAAAQREAHTAAVAAQEAAHQQRRARNEQLEHDNRQQAIIIAELQASVTSASARLAATQQHNAALHRYAVAHGAAYGRLAAHAAGLHQQFARQLSGLRQLCRHLGLQLGTALAAADPVGGAGSAAGQAGSSGGGAGTAAVAVQEGSGPESSAAAVAAAVLSIEGLRMELQVAEQLLDMQAGSGEAQQLAAVPAGIADALAADLAGLPAEFLTSPRLEVHMPPSAAASPGRSCKSSPAVTAASSPKPHRQHQQQLSPASLPTAVQGAAPPGAPTAASTAATSAAAGARSSPSSVLSAQVAQMEAHLERLVGSCTEQAARVAAAVQLHGQERAARQQAQEAAAELSSRLTATQADLDAARQQRDELDTLSQRLAQELRDAIYSISQLCAHQQGQLVSRAVRGLTDVAVQTQYCRLWEANLGGGCSSCGAGVAGGSEDCDSVLYSVQSSSRSTDAGSGGGSDDGAAAGETSGPGTGRSDRGAGEAEQAPVRVLSLPALQQQIKEVYCAKALHALAVARGQKAFMPLPDFVASHLVLQSGAEGHAVRQRARQLQASVEAHAGVYEVAMFGLSAGVLEEAPGGLVPTVGSKVSAAGVARPGAGPSGCASTPGATAVPLVLYQGQRRQGGAPQHARDAAVPALRRFCAASWHAAYLRSAARSPLPQPFSPAGGDLIHGMASEVHNLALGVPGVEQLMCWVLGGGVADCLPQMDLGLRLAENQVPQLYLLAAESCRLLGLPGTPQVYVRSSSEAAAHYLMLPPQARLHGLNGSAATEGSAAASGAPSAGAAGVSPCRGGAPAPSVPGLSQEGSDASLDGLVLRVHSALSMAESSAVGAGLLAAAAEGAPSWQCAVVLTSGLVDVLEPEELQAVITGCLAFHAALTSPASYGDMPGTSPAAAAQLAVLCRSMAALGTLGALGALCPDALARRLPHQMAPFLHTRILPLLRRALRYLSLYCDRVAGAAAGGWHPVATAAIKQAAGAAVLRNELSLEAVLQQAMELEEAGAELLPQAVLREDSATLAGAAPSLTLLRVRELQKWFGARGCAAGQASK